MTEQERQAVAADADTASLEELEAAATTKTATKDKTIRNDGFNGATCGNCDFTGIVRDCHLKWPGNDKTYLICPDCGSSVIRIF